MTCHLHLILCSWDAVATCTPVTIFFPLGVRLYKNSRVAMAAAATATLKPTALLCLISEILTPLQKAKHQMTKKIQKYAFAVSCSITVLIISFQAKLQYSARVLSAAQVDKKVACFQAGGQPACLVYMELLS